MICEYKCPACGGDIKVEDVLDTEFSDGSYYDFTIGECAHCGNRYQWSSVYGYHHIEDFKRIPVEVEGA